MSRKLASPMGFSTAAETAWFNQELLPEHASAHDAVPTGQRRVLTAFAATLFVLGSVLGVARANMNPQREPLQLSMAAPQVASKAAPAAAVAPSKAKPKAVKTATTHRKVKAKAKKSTRRSRHR